jgi:hypothetical protein
VSAVNPTAPAAPGKPDAGPSTPLATSAPALPEFVRELETRVAARGDGTEAAAPAEARPAQGGVPSAPASLPNVQSQAAAALFSRGTKPRAADAGGRQPGPDRPQVRGALTVGGGRWRR